MQISYVKQVIMIIGLFSFVGLDQAWEDKHRKEIQFHAR